MIEEASRKHRRNKIKAWIILAIVSITFGFISAALQLNMIVSTLLGIIVGMIAMQICIKIFGI